MKLIDKSRTWDNVQTFVGKYKKVECRIYYSEKPSFWYFVCHGSEKSINYNSLWENKKFSTKELTHDACVKYIDEQLKLKNK